MEMKFKFDNGEVLTLDVFDTSISKKILELCETCKADGVELYQRLLGHEAGRTAKRLEHIPHSDKEEALETIRKGFALTGIEPNVSLSDTMTVQDCNIIHRQFTTEGMNWGENPSDYDMEGKHVPKYNMEDLQYINQGVHAYESTLPSPNFMEHDDILITDMLFGYNLWIDIVKQTFRPTVEEKCTILQERKFLHADVYVYDECRVGRSFQDAWAQNDDPRELDIQDVDRVGPLFNFRNSIRKKLYKSIEFHNWLEKYDSVDKPYADIPFANIVRGSYQNAHKANLVDITW
tara:strand:- start:5510 stop:6382 length:873 start_codon:yes stop_codon:yes gene_type:complete